MSKVTKHIDQILDHVRERADGNITKMPEWVLKTQRHEQPWWTNIFRRYCVACGYHFGGGEAWQVLANVQMLSVHDVTVPTRSVNVCAHCGPTESILASRLCEPRTQKNILALL